MTFIVSNKGVNNTEGTTAKFGSGKISVGGDFKNTGNVEVDIRATLNVAGNVVNAGNFHIKDYITQDRYKTIESALKELEGEPRKYLLKSYDNLKNGKFDKSDSWFNKFFSYIKKHPELVTGSVQILLQLLLSGK